MPRISLTLIFRRDLPALTYKSNAHRVTIIALCIAIICCVSVPRRYCGATLKQAGLGVIVPITEERRWLDVLADLPPLTHIYSRIVLISPHPDDETLCAGAFLAAQRSRGAEIVVVAVTDGENAYDDNEGLAATRRSEQMSALRELGISADCVRHFGLTDSGLESQRHQLVDRLMPLVTPKTLILAPWIGDYHPDHKVCGWAAHNVARQKGTELLWYFFWTWHRGTPDDLRDLSLCAFGFDEALLAQKLRALQCHVSQLHRVRDEPILPASLLAPARRTFEVFAKS
jgi:LmbE family N-acetylglucosaminyl deacetylase